MYENTGGEESPEERLSGARGSGYQDLKEEPQVACMLPACCWYTLQRICRWRSLVITTHVMEGEKAALYPTGLHVPKIFLYCCQFFEVSPKIKL